MNRLLCTLACILLAFNSKAQYISGAKDTLAPAVKRQGPLYYTASYTSSHWQRQPLPNPLRPGLYVDHLGFFCRQELKLEQRTKFPLQLRLGSPDYCNWLESKTAYKYPPR